jgi:serine/threonine protein kinase
MMDQIGSYRLGKRREVTAAWFVCDAVDARLDRSVVLKVLTGLDAEARARFHREATALMAVEHPSIVMLHDYSGIDEPTPFIAYEALTGPTLETVLQERGALPGVAHAALFTQLANALSALHERGITHGALTPAHIHLEADGRAVITQFELAVSEGMRDGTLAGRGTAIVTEPLFVLPNAPTRSLAADVYALGMLMTYAWIGGPPVDLAMRDAPQRIAARRFKRAGDARADVSQKLTALADRIVHSDVRPSAAELAELLQAQWSASAGGLPEAALREWLIGHKDPNELVRRLLASGDHDGALMAASGGRYTELSPLGAGGMGRVTRAKDTRLQRDVAIKTILDPSGDPDACMRFHREARAMGRVRHPNVVEVIDYSGRGAVLPYLVLEFLDAAVLRGVLDVTKLPENVALCVLYELADALVAVHAQGLVHRDIKPENVFVDGNGRIVLSDFGIVRGIEGASETFVRSATQAIGSPAFASPEQVFDPDALTQASDLFSLGSLLHAMLTGQSPFFAASAVDCVRALKSGKKQPLPKKVSPFVQQLRDRLLSPRPDVRPTAEAVLRLLSTALAERGIVDRRHTIRVFLGEEREATRIFDLATQVRRVQSDVPTPRTHMLAQTKVSTAPSRPPTRKPTPPVEQAASPWLVITAAVVAACVIVAVLGWVLVRRREPAKSTARIEDARPLPAPAEEVVAPPLPSVTTVPSVPVIATPKGPPPKKEKDAVAAPPSPAVKDSPGELRLSTGSAWANVTIDGVLYGKTPFFRSKTLSPGKHTVLFENPAFKTQTHTVTIQPGEATELRVVLQK